MADLTPTPCSFSPCSSWRFLKSSVRSEGLWLEGCRLNPTVTGCEGVGSFVGCFASVSSFLPAVPRSKWRSSTTFWFLPLCTKGRVSTSNPWLICFLALLPLITWLKFDLKATLCLRNTNNRFQKLTGKVDSSRFFSCGLKLLRDHSFEETLLNLPPPQSL